MATKTFTFVVSQDVVELTDTDGEMRGHLSGRPPNLHDDQVTRVVYAEFDANGTTSGTVTITATA